MTGYEEGKQGQAECYEIGISFISMNQRQYQHQAHGFNKVNR